MTDPELRIKVAEAMGYADVDTTTDFIGRLSGVLNGVRRLVPNWPEDLPACMAPGGPLMWLIGGGHSIRGEFGATGSGQPWAEFQVLVANPRDKHDILAILPSVSKYFEGPMAPTICHAVLAVAEKLKGQSDAEET